MNKCIDSCANFLFLLFGQDRALLIDTGPQSQAGILPVRQVVNRLVKRWVAVHNPAQYELVVTHTHDHGDHTQGDPQFVGQLQTTLVGASLPEVQSFYGFTNWPDQIVSYDLGGRVLDLIPSPGHQSAEISFYDRECDLLFTGDVLLPGYLFIIDHPAYVATVARLWNFAQANPITFVLGCHVEMTATPGVPFPFGVTYQPNEHVLQLDVGHLQELHDALQAMGLPLQQEQHDDFLIMPF